MIGGIYIRKAWELHPLPVPRIEALASPFSQERTTQSPRRYINTQTPMMITHHSLVRIIYAHEHLPLPCL
ncbi:MAG: hypothetical protein E7087_07920 [Bacteroidales bacterium]|nr:hypothetical protein [Bacteroidales bacterium]